MNGPQDDDGRLVLPKWFPTFAVAVVVACALAGFVLGSVL